MLALSSSSALEETLLLTPHHLQKNLPPAFVDTTTRVIRVLIFTTTYTPPVFTFSDSERTEKKADDVSADHPAQAASLTSLSHVKKLGIVPREGRRLRSLALFSVAEKNPIWDLFSVPLQSLGVRLAVQLYLVDCVLRHAMSATFCVSLID